MQTLLALAGLILCYNTTNMQTEILDYPNQSQAIILDADKKESIKKLHPSIYGMKVVDLGLYLCSYPE